jgi:hypothetical protein
MQKRRGHKLALAHRSGPRAGHVARADIAAVDDPQCGDQLAAKIRAAAAVEAERRERGDNEVITGDLAEIAFHPPQRDNKARIDPITAMNRLQQTPVLIKRAACVFDALRAYRLLQVLGEGQQLLGLVTVKLDDMREVLRIA